MTQFSTNAGEKEAISHLWNDFAENTGFHAFNKLPIRKRSKLRWIWWFMAITMMFGVLAYNLYKELEIYYKRTTLTNVNVRGSKNEPFPAITICNFSPFNMTRLNPDSTMRSFFAKLSYLQAEGGKANWSDPNFGSFYSQNLTKEWLLNVSVDLDVMLETCKFDGVSQPCRNYFKPVILDNSVCFAFNSDYQHTRKTKLWGAEANLNMQIFLDQKNYMYSPNMEAGVKVIVHDPHIIPTADSPSVLAADGMTTHIGIRKTQYKFLPEPFIAFGDRPCVETDATDFVNPLDHKNDSYTYEKCMSECRAKHLYRKCGCFGLSDSISGPYCSLKLKESCYLPEYYAIYLDQTIRESCDCYMPCAFDMYTTKVSATTYLSDLYLDYVKEKWNLNSTDYIRKNYLSLRVYYEDLLVQVIEQSPVYTPETILGSLGGHMGLWMGASILTVGEIGEFLIMVVLHLFRKLCGKSNNKLINTVQQW
ncbi:hypothetical protein SNE40_017044 [Patella caerulea]|uniref:Uncharacterized protein n=1 Tax=Patella caerulea TaxID=87958 RepID=A0AAN8J9P6_PATCE